jgi:hypothetical protein
VANGEGVLGVSVDSSEFFLLLFEEIESELVLLLGTIGEAVLRDVVGEGGSKSFILVADFVFDTNERGSVAE